MGLKTVYKPNHIQRRRIRLYLIKIKRELFFELNLLFYDWLYATVLGTWSFFPAAGHSWKRFWAWYSFFSNLLVLFEFNLTFCLHFIHIEIWIHRASNFRRICLGTIHKLGRQKYRFFDSLSLTFDDVAFWRGFLTVCLSLLTM